ncbi:MAG: hypothetical protein KatS3mg020_0439 [Fimbriimonadales bacterium]|nr:MAG: hypothetical protein KatS3mg020_0439 [Fimbriimonadales bacterium]
MPRISKATRQQIKGYLEGFIEGMLQEYRQWQRRARLSPRKYLMQKVSNCCVFISLVLATPLLLRPTSQCPTTPTGAGEKTITGATRNNISLLRMSCLSERSSGIYWVVKEPIASCCKSTMKSAKQKRTTYWSCFEAVILTGNPHYCPIRSRALRSILRQMPRKPIACFIASSVSSAIWRTFCVPV